MQILHKAGYTHCIYATFNNGLAYQFLDGDTLTVDNVREPKVYTLVAERMAQMHLLNPSDPEISREPIIWWKTEKFLDLMPKEFPDPDKQERSVILYI